MLQHYNIILFGNRLFQELRSVMLNCKQLQAVFKNIVWEDIRVSYNVEEEFVEFYSFFLSTYAKVWGKDYCRRCMSENELSLTKGVRTMLAVLSDPKHRSTYTNNNADQDSDQASLEETGVTEPPDDMYEYHHNSNLINMFCTYKSSSNEELYQLDNDSSHYSDYDSDEIDPYNYFECEDEAQI